MGIQVAGKKPTGEKKLKIENTTTIDLPKKTEENIQRIVNFLPVEHIRGLERIRLVDFIDDPRLKDVKEKTKMQGDLPGLYHPKVQNKSPWLEVSIGALTQPTEGFFKRLMAKASFKSNLAGLIFSLVGQHYFLTMRHSVKKQNLEPQIRQYAEKKLRAWSEKESENTIRGKLFKPLRPIIERWVKWLNKRAKTS
ncbi:MAG: hypothetical protein DWQ47_05190 [Acidobacteria bacterium]|nr:MAG: hypothetical protein DWQ32_08740 [Acidobacteriota bacterium]REK01777.1 MAG: hypothetical protein DWQ38_05175 [Acidobacteriota bacterium]REK14733.1 MAG: hypothetical protein DWQ43_14430 [Acidobacteriota bacterium]REK45448.1 MAG: hypothetical protein DWQ47_05190 [Acidobacteriota bacterium]